MEIKEVKTKKELKEFIHLPAKVHKGHPEWLPPLYMDDKKLFSSEKNSSFKHCDTILLLAFEQGKAVGRIMGIIPHKYNTIHQVNCVRFGFMECFENKLVFDALLKAVEDWGRERKCEDIIGPMGFSDKDPQGFVVKGFKEPTMMVTNCNWSFMPEYIMANGYEGHIDLCQYEVPISEAIVNRYHPLAARVEKHNQITVHDFTSIRAIRPYIDSVFALINKTYKEIYGFSALSKDEIHEFANRFLPLLNPRLIKIITGPNNEVLACVIAMADLSEGIKKAGGKILPLGWIHLLRANFKSKRLVLLLGAIDETMRNKGLDAILGFRLIRSAIKEKLDVMDSHLIMYDNYKMRREIERLENYREYKRYRIFRKSL